MNVQRNRIVSYLSFLFFYSIVQLNFLQAEESSSLAPSKLTSNTKTIDQACPKCGSSSVVEIIYGKPAPELMERAERGEVVLGGCVLEGDDPDFACKSCSYKWVRLKY